MEQDKVTPEQIMTEVNHGLAFLSLHLREWVQGHSIEHHQIRLATDPGGTSFKDLWLITDHNGQKDSSYRVVYDEEAEAFGLECTLDSGVEWYMGIYGSFSQAVDSM
jgi:hypothetical protein